MQNDNGVEILNDYEYKSKNNADTSKTSALTKFFINAGLAKNEKQSNYIMIVVILLCLIASAYFFGYYVFGIGNSPQVKVIIPPGLQDQLNNTRTQ